MFEYMDWQDPISAFLKVVHYGLFISNIKKASLDTYSFAHIIEMSVKGHNRGG